MKQILLPIFALVVTSSLACDRPEEPAPREEPTPSRASQSDMPPLEVDDFQPVPAEEDIDVVEHQDWVEEDEKLDRPEPEEIMLDDDEVEDEPE